MSENTYKKLQKAGLKFHDLSQVDCQGLEFSKKARPQNNERGKKEEKAK